LPAGYRDAISVVISTYQRPDACERALRSVLQQTEQPLEVLICDDGSADETPERFREWERTCELVRYLRLPANTGTPAATRNLGIAEARGEWIAFLDDDDAWLPHKLARQRSAMASYSADLVASNALRRDGSPYFADPPAVLIATRAELLRGNPIITSSVLVRRSLVSFPTALWLRGVEDYAAWLEIVDRGSRLIVLGEPLISYEDMALERLSTARARTTIAVARLAWQRLAHRPRDREDAAMALRWTAGALYVLAHDALATVWAHLRRSAPGP
jgi:teichuronic acid biosynthesis glycosyltransferase TuaG